MIKMSKDLAGLSKVTEIPEPHSCLPFRCICPDVKMELSDETKERLRKKIQEELEDDE